MSVNIYDSANALARDIKQTDEYIQYKRLRDEVMANETNKALINKYKKLQFQLQVSMSGGGQPNPEEMEQLQKIAQVLQLSQDTAGYLLAEMRLQKMLADVYKIIGEAADMDMDFLQLSQMLR